MLLSLYLKYFLLSLSLLYYYYCIHLKCFLLLLLLLLFVFVVEEFYYIVVSNNISPELTQSWRFRVLNNHDERCASRVDQCMLNTDVAQWFENALGVGLTTKNALSVYEYFVMPEAVLSANLVKLV